MASFSWDLPTKAKDSLWEADSSRPTNAFGTNFGCFVVNAKKKKKQKKSESNQVQRKRNNNSK